MSIDVFIGNGLKVVTTRNCVGTCRTYILTVTTEMAESLRIYCNCKCMFSGTKLYNTSTSHEQSLSLPQMSTGAAELT